MANVLFIINDNASLPVPNTMSVTLQDIDSDKTGRNQKGTMIRDRVAGGAKAKRKVNCTWAGLTTSEISKLLKAIGGVSMKLKYIDPYVGDYKTITCYVGDRSTPVYNRGYETVTDAKNIIWESLSANFVEF